MILPMLKGLVLTLNRFFSKPITVQYPEERIPSAPRWRGVQYFEKDERGKTKCVACGLCMAVCPSQCIYIETAEDEEGRRYPMTYELDSSRCIYCGFCEEACPVNAIFMGRTYDWVEGERKPLLMDTEHLLQNKDSNP
jgi:NADH-quinone oxidoreductase subunit I